MNIAEYYGLRALAADHPDAKVNIGDNGEAVVDPSGPMSESDWARLAEQVTAERSARESDFGENVTKQLARR